MGPSLVNSFNLALKTKLHIAWILTIAVSAVVGGVFSFILRGFAGMMLWELLIVVLYLQGLVSILNHLASVKLQTETRETKKALSDVAGTVGRSAPLIRTIEATVQYDTSKVSPQVAAQSTEHFGKNDNDRELHEAAQIVLLNAGLTSSTRAVLTLLKSHSHLLAVTNSNWPAAAIELGLIESHKITTVSPGQLPEVSVSLAARTSVLVLDQPCVKELTHDHSKWIRTYLRWCPPRSGMYFVNSLAGSRTAVAASVMVDKYDCFLTQVNGITAAFPLKTRHEDDA